MFEIFSNKLDKIIKSDDKLYQYGQAHEVEVQVTFKKTYKVKARVSDDAALKVTQKIMKQNKAYKNAGLDFLNVKVQKVERISDD